VTELAPARKAPEPIRMRLELYRPAVAWVLPVPGTEKTKEFTVAGALPVFDKVTRMAVTPAVPGK
jgi:hypothetical protein